MEFSVEDHPRFLEEISSLCKTGIKALQPQVKSRLTLGEESKLYSSIIGRPSPVLTLPPHIDPMEIARVKPVCIGVRGFVMERYNSMDGYNLIKLIEPSSRPQLETRLFDAREPSTT